MELQELIEKALAFFDAPDSKALDLDGLEEALREAQKFYKTQSLQASSLTLKDSESMGTDSESVDADEESKENEELAGLTSEKDCYRDHIARQIQGYMRVMNYSDSEISDVETITDPVALLAMEKRIRAEFDDRFHTPPLVADEDFGRIVNVGVYRIA